MRAEKSLLGSNAYIILFFFVVSFGLSIPGTVTIPLCHIVASATAYMAHRNLQWWNVIGGKLN